VGEVAREGTRLWYEEQGNGDPLVLIGGIGHPVCMWGEVLGLLARSFRVVAFDNRGTGRSDKPQTGYSMDAFVEDTLAVIQALGLNRPHVLGFSLGGFIAQALACQHGDELSRLVLVNTAFGGPKYAPPGMDVINALLQGPHGDTPLERGVDALRYDFTDAFLREHHDVVERIVACMLEQPQPAYAYQGQAAVGGSFNMEAEVHSIRNPTLVIVADQDRIVPPENGMELQKAIPGARLGTIADAGHMVFIERPEEFGRTVTQFLKGEC
jgi:pimeloyl-ACP methyl ester carboxylesterase